MRRLREMSGSNLQIELFIRKVLVQAIVAGERMSLHAFGAGNTRAGGAHRAVSLAVHALPGHRFDEFAHAQAARVPGGALGGQNMVRSRSLVAVGDGGLLAQEQ